MIISLALGMQVGQVYVIGPAGPAARARLLRAICHGPKCSKPPEPTKCQNVVGFDAAKRRITVVDSPSRNDSDPDAMPALHRPLQFLALAVTTSAFSAVAFADTLVDIYELALENDAQLKAQVAQYNADVELEKLALAPLLPQASAGYSYTDSENDSTRPNVRVTPEGTLDQIDVTSETNTETDGYDVSLSQTLFDLSAWFSWKAGKENSRRAEADLSAAQQDLIVRVVQSYFGVLRAQDNLRASQAQERAFERQLEQTRQRFEVGLIAITDVYEAEAARDLAQVTRIVDENNVAVAKENLSVLTGQTPGALFVLGETFDPKPPEPAERAAWVDFAMSNNYRLAASRFAEEAARQTATSSRMGHAPTVTATYRYQDTETTGSIRQSPESLFNFPPDSEQTNESWQIRFDLPLSAGGAISANRRRAAEQFNAARETRINLTRTTVTQARSLHMTVMSDVSRVMARKQSIVSSQSALDATQAGYEVGTRNIVDVLNAAEQSLCCATRLRQQPVRFHHQFPAFKGSRRHPFARGYRETGRLFVATPRTHRLRQRVTICDADQRAACLIRIGNHSPQGQPTPSGAFYLTTRAGSCMSGRRAQPHSAP
ncbi:MAG: hypothetical protein CM15mP74_14280 [Halieaceae bacterium]|nr:MAG: hypothetical protein CM15mP74_14280 [Halieaceae bacterium]